MKKVNLILLALVAIYLLAAPLALGQGEKIGKARGGNVEEQIKALSDKVVQAELKSDTNLIEKYLADDCTIIHGDGRLFTKAEEIESFKSGALKYEVIDVREKKIRIYGDTAVVIVLVFSKGTYGGKPFSGDFRSSWIFVKQKGNWKKVAYQVTRVAPASQ